MTPKLTVTATTAKAAGLTNNVPYFFAVTSVNLSGGEDKTVITKSATPVLDLIGPEMSNFKVNGALLSDGFTLTVPGSFSLDAADPAGVSRIEFYLDGIEGDTLKFSSFYKIESQTMPIFDTMPALDSFWRSQPHPSLHKRVIMKP